MPFFKYLSNFINIVICIVLSATFALAQDESYSNDEAGEEELTNLSFVEFTLDRIFPIGTYKENLDRKLWGASFSYLFQYNKDKLDFAGFQINYSRIGGVSNSFSDSDVITGSNIIGVQGVYRVFPDFYFWKFEPFIEVELGPQFFYTQTTTSFFDENSSDDIDFTEFDTSIMYGIGTGFTLHIVENVFLMSKISFNGGTSVTYLVDRSEDLPFPLDNFRPETTQINYLKWRFGITVSI